MNEIVLAWQLTDSTRCVVVGLGWEYDLCVISHNTVLRRCQFADVLDALEVARRWRTDFLERTAIASDRAPVVDVA